MASRSKNPRSKTATKKPVKKRTASKKTKRSTVKSPQKVEMPENPIFLDVPWDEKSFASKKGAKYYGGDIRSWIWSGKLENMPSYLTDFLPDEYSLLSWKQQKHNPISTKKVDTKNIVLRKDQKETLDLAVQGYAAGTPGFVLHHDTGLGKTYTSISIANEVVSGNVLVIAPLAVHESWRRSLNDLGIGNNNYCIINYQSLKKLLDVPDAALKAKRNRTKNKAIATKGKAIEQWDVVIADESQFLKNPSALQTQAYFTLRNGAWVIWSSASPGEKPSDFVYMSDLFEYAASGKFSHNHRKFSVWSKQLGLHVEDTDYGSADVKWDDSHEEDNDLIHKIFFENVPPLGDVRTSKSIPGWPELQRIPFPIKLKKEEMASYNKLWNDFRSEHNLAKKGKNPENGLAAQMRFRQKTSILRIPYVASLIETLISEGKQVPVSVEFKESTMILSDILTKKKISHVVINGETSVKEKGKNRIDFQQGKVDVVIYSVKEGISFHANEESVGGSSTPRVGVLADPRWSGIATKQIEGRQHRNGENAPVYHCFIGDTIDEKIVTTTMEKMEQMNRISGNVESLMLQEFESFM